MREDEAWVQLKAAADGAALRGSLLFHLDLATALGVEALARAGVATDLIATVIDEGGYCVLALEDRAVPQRLARVRFAADSRPQLHRDEGAATQPEAALARARRTVADARLTGAARATAIAIPQRAAAAPGDPIEVYALALAERPGDVVLGIHWHTTVSGDGATLLSRTPLSRSALVLPARGEEAPPFAVQVTHFGAVPSEIHTYASLKHGMALSVAALDSAVVWAVEGERTTVEGRIPADGVA